MHDVRKGLSNRFYGRSESVRLNSRPSELDSRQRCDRAVPHVGFRCRAAVVIAMVGSLALTGCAGPEVNDGLTINEAKSRTQQMESRIAALVPKEYVLGQDQAASGILMPCGNGLYQWLGHTHLKLTSDPDFERILRAILAGVRQDHNYDARMGKRIDGEPRADIGGRSQEFYMAAPVVDDRTDYEISSSSPCFKLPEGMQPGDKY